MPHVPDHQTDHDPLLVAAYAAGDAEGDGLDRARELVATCTECAVLHHDLRAIAAAMPATPAPARTRDFRLSPEQAAQLRPAGWRRLLAPLAGPRFAFAAPLGGSLAALGIAGILVAGLASTPIAGTGQSSLNAARDQQTSPVAASTEPGAEALSGPASAAPASAEANMAAPVPAASAAASAVAPDAGVDTGAGGGGIAGTGPAASEATSLADGYKDRGRQDGQPVATIAGDVDTTVSTPTPSITTMPPVLQVVSGFLLIAGLVLLALAIVRRRMGRAPG
jgi:hypothetical protein